MTVVQRDQTSFTVDSTKARYIPVPEGQQVTVYNTGNTLYYKSTSSVTSASSDGTIASAASASFTTPQFVITATGVDTNLIVTTTEGDNGNFRVGGTMTAVGAQTLTGATTHTAGIVPASIHGVSNWQPVAATSGTDTTPADGTLFLTSIFVPANKTLKGVGYLIGSVGGTDRVVVNLWSTAGVNLAQSTTASNGTVCGTAANVQEIDFATAYSAVGPGLYYVGVAAKGTTCRLRTVPAFTQAGIFGGSVSQTHAATTTLSPPGTFTADKAPVVYLYS